MRSAWVGGSVCVLTIVIGLLTLDRLPPTVGPVFLVPTLLAGIGLVMQSTAGRGLGTLGALLSEDSWGHVPLVLLGWTFITLGTLGLLRLPSAGAVAVLRLTETLPTACEGPPPVRVPLNLLPTFIALDKHLATVEGSIHSTGVHALQEVMPRCVRHLQAALDAPDGTHGSWGLLRQWMVEHPRYGILEPALVNTPLRPQTHRPKRPPVQLDFSP